MMRISYKMAQGLWHHLQDQYFTRLVPRDDESAMRAAHWILDILGVRSHDTFLAHYGLTMIESVCLPFCPGDVTAGWRPVDQAAMIVHECHHAWQADEYGGMVFAAGYLTRPQMRAHLEAEAYRAQMEFVYRATRRLPQPEGYAQQLRHYGCEADEIRYCNAFLNMATPHIYSGSGGSPVTEAAMQWIEQNPDWPGPS